MACGLVAFIALASVVAIRLSAGETSSNAEYPMENGVLILNETNYNQFLNNRTLTLVAFLTPWCSFCQSLKSDYEQVAKELEGRVDVVKVIADENRELANNESVVVFPTILLNVNGYRLVYDGEKKAGDILSWVNLATRKNLNFTQDSVIEVSPTNNLNYLRNLPLSMVLFYSVNCSICEEVAKTYEKAAKRLAIKKSNVRLLKINCHEHPQASEEFNIHSFPSIRLFRLNQPSLYAGPMDDIGMAKYLEELEVQPAKEISTVRELRMWMKNRTETLIIALFDQHQAWMYDSFMESADSIRHFPETKFSFSPSVRANLPGQREDEWLYIMLPEILTTEYENRLRGLSNQDTAVEKINNFILKNSVPLVWHRTVGNTGWYTSAYNKPLVVAYFTIDFSHLFLKSTQYWHRKIANVANDYRDYSFAISDDLEFQDELLEANLDDSPMDINIIVTGIDGRQFKMDPETYGEFSEETLRQFMHKLNTGKIKPHKKKKLSPSANEKDLLIEVTEETFESIVLDESSDVVIMFHNIHCGHCIEAFPIYRHVAKLMSHVKGLKFAKLDATQGVMIKNYPIAYFPAIYFAARGKKNRPILYHGERKTNDMITFFTSHLSPTPNGKTEL